MPSSSSVKAVLARYRPLVDAEIARALRDRADVHLYDMIRYHLGLSDGGTASAAGGKRVRSAFCLLACEAAGGEAATAAPAGAAVELVHSFTLLHDDIADRDETRRGQATVWRLWGVGQAITAGDAVYALANLAAAELEKKLPPKAALAALRELNQAVLDVCEGQQLDISYEGRNDIGEADYLRMIGLKTAALLRSACAIGAIAAGAEEEIIKALGQFGFGVGVAYQIHDDMLGAWGDPAVMGKPVGSDLRRNKRTLPVILALASENEELRARLRAALGQSLSDEQAAEIAGRMADHGIKRQCEEMVRGVLDSALAQLDGVGLAPGPTAELRALVSYLTKRTH